MRKRESARARARALSLSQHRDANTPGYQAVSADAQRPETTGRIPVRASTHFMQIRVRMCVVLQAHTCTRDMITHLITGMRFRCACISPFPQIYSQYTTYIAISFYTSDE